MYFPLILFFISLIGITLMIGRKLVLVRNGQAVKIQYSHPFVPDIQKIKQLTFRGLKRTGYVVVFVSLRFFIKSSNFIKTKGVELAEELKRKFDNNKDGAIEEKKEVSKYLRIISEYRQKIRKIKHRIKEEEGIK